MIERPNTRCKKIRRLTALNRLPGTLKPKVGTPKSLWAGGENFEKANSLATFILQTIFDLNLFNPSCSTQAARGKSITTTNANC